MEGPTGKRSAVVGAVALLLIAAVAAGSYAVLRQAPASQPMSVDGSYVAPDTVAITHTVKGNEHIFSGAIPMSSTCNKVASGVSYDQADGAIAVSLAVDILVAQDGTCQGVADSITQTFNSSFVSPNTLPVKLASFTINGKPVRFTEK